MRHLSLLALTTSVVLAACSTASKDIAPTYISPLQFQSYDCGQLAAESARIQGRVNEVGGRLDQAASNDKTITGAGIILFWPALFFLGGTKQQEADFARLRGEYDAVQQASIQKRCTVAGPAVAPTTAPAIGLAVPAVLSAVPTQASSVAAPLAPTVQSAQVVQAVPRTAEAQTIGQDSYNVERMPDVRACNPSPRAALSSRGPGFENYTVACTSGDVLVVRCDLGNCRVLK